MARNVCWAVGTLAGVVATMRSTADDAHTHGVSFSDESGFRGARLAPRRRSGGISLVLFFRLRGRASTLIRVARYERRSRDRTPSSCCRPPPRSSSSGSNSSSKSNRRRPRRPRTRSPPPRVASTTTTTKASSTRAVSNRGASFHIPRVSGTAGVPPSRRGRARSATFGSFKPARVPGVRTHIYPVPHPSLRTGTPQVTQK